MALLTTQPIQITGTAPSYAAAAAGGDKVPPGNRTFVHIKNGSAAAITATVVVPGQMFGQELPDVAVSVPAGGDRMIGPLVPQLAVNGNVDITYSAVTSVTIAALTI